MKKLAVNAGSPTAPRLQPKHLLPGLALVLLVGLAYWPGRAGGFVFDDFPNIVANTALHVTTWTWHDWIAAIFSSEAGNLQRPLAMLTFAVNHYFTGLDSMPMKLTNIAIHALNALLALGLVRQLLILARPNDSEARRREWAARFTAAAWALHPINLMAVLFVVQRMESLSHTFVLAGLWCYLVGRQRQLAGGNGWPWIFAGLFAASGLGILAKESGLLLPLYAFLAELCVLGFRDGGGQRDRRLCALYILLLTLPTLLGLAWLLPKVALPSAYALRDFTLVERLLTESRVVLDYLRWILLPDLGQLSLYHDDYPISRGLLQPPTTLLALLAIPALLGFAWRYRRRRPLVALGLLWFFSAHLLTATLVPLELVYEHRNYFASLGICLVLADLLLLMPREAGNRRIGALVAVLVVVGYTGITHLRAREWSDPYRFAASEAAKHPVSPRATYSLAQILVVLTEYRRDSPFAKPALQALERARHAPRSGILPHSGLLLLAANSSLQQQDVWWQEMEYKLRQGPIGPQEIGALAALVRCASAGRCHFPDHQLLACIEAAERHGPNPDVLSLHGEYVLNVHGDFTSALRLWRQAIQRSPKTAQYRINLIKLLIARGNRDEAVRQIAELRALGRLGQNEAAAADLQRRLAGSSGTDDGMATPK